MSWSSPRVCVFVQRVLIIRLFYLCLGSACQQESAGGRQTLRLCVCVCVCSQQAQSVRSLGFSETQGCVWRSGGGVHRVACRVLTAHVCVSSWPTSEPCQDRKWNSMETLLLHQRAVLLSFMNRSECVCVHQHNETLELIERHTVCSQWAVVCWACKRVTCVWFILAVCWSSL